MPDFALSPNFDANPKGISKFDPNFDMLREEFFEYPIDYTKSKEQRMFERAGGASQDKNRQRRAKPFVKVAGEWRC
jgi:hypothetical protein